MLHYLVIGSMFKDEADYLVEWVEFHLQRGVDHIYLYDNGSTDGGAATLEPFITTGQVTLIDWPQLKTEGSQRQAAHDCLARARTTSRWMAFIDIDEFLFSPRESLKAVLREYEREVGVEVNWVCYGSSNHSTKPHSGVLQSFCYRAPLYWKRNRQFKSIVDPKQATTRHAGSHAWQYAEDRLAVNERGVKIGDQQDLVFRLERKMRLLFPTLYDWIARTFPLLLNRYSVIDRKVSVNRLRINHYVIKSRSEYNHKRERHGPLRADKYSDSFFFYHDRNEVYDPILKAIQTDDNHRSDHQ